MANPTSDGPAYWTELRNDLSENIAAIQKDDLRPIPQAQEGMRLSQEALAKLKESLHRFSFANPAEQIFYFKEIEPFFVSRVIFFARVFHLETGRPPGDRVTVESHFQKEWQYIRDFHTEHRFLCRYIHAGETWLDEKLFVPATNMHIALPDSGLCDSLLHNASD